MQVIGIFCNETQEILKFNFAADFLKGVRDEENAWHFVFLACRCAAVLAGGFFGGLGGYRIYIEWILYF